MANDVKRFAISTGDVVAGLHTFPLWPQARNVPLSGSSAGKIGGFESDRIAQGVKGKKVKLPLCLLI
jgi:hypothetical protein